MDIRGPRLKKQSDAALEFTSSMRSDAKIARQVIRVNMAHMVALVRSGEVTGETGSACAGFLLSASPAMGQGTKSEDYHQRLEQEAVDSLGVATAGFLNFGKSRNDQVAAAVRMELRAAILDLLEAVLDLQTSLLWVAERHASTIIPGYTHLQRAQPVTLAHHLLAHFDALGRDAERLFQLYPRVNRSPMGAAALAGTSVPVDRDLVSELLGFDEPVRNSVDAVSSRDFLVEAIACAATSMLDASRLAEEQILWGSKEFGFIELDDAYSASSSIMPQKKNAVVSELVRAKAGTVLGSFAAAGAILKAIPYSYNLDLQEATPHLWRATDDATTSLRMLAGAVATMKVRAVAMSTAASEDDSTAVALANYIVKTHRLSFRQAHAIVGELVRVASERNVPLARIASAQMPRASAKFGKRLTIDESTASSLLDPMNFVKAISTAGGANPRFAAAELARRRKEVASNRAELRKLGSRLRASEKRLLRATTGLAREVKTKE